MPIGTTLFHITTDTTMTQTDVISVFAAALTKFMRQTIDFGQ